MHRALLLVGAGILASAVVSACMSRPVGTTEPHTSNLYVEPIRKDAIEKIDLLFMIDNSRSMGDKQKLLAHAVPQLVDRLVVPRCVNQAGESRARAALDEPCAAGFAPEFRAVRDIHVAVVSSSLGAHGASGSSCGGSAHGDDRAHLLPSVRAGLSSYQNSGFLAWDPDHELVPPGETDPARLGQAFGDMVKAADEDGCGFEASLESWYRFLIDPEPPLQIAVQDSLSVATGIDTELLAQREAFLRPDSLVAIVMLTDENDCSIQDEAFGHLLANENRTFRMPRGSSACARDPNDPCCLPCTVTEGVPASCPPLADDPACKLGSRLTESEDPTNLRCLENKRRFGYDFLYPTSRYVDALTRPVVPRRSTGELVENPLFKAPPGVPRRTSSLIYLAGIVGVPWQDVADDASLSGNGLRYRTAQELEAAGRWQVMLGDSAKQLPPQDPFMQESTAPRAGQNPVTGDPIVAATSQDPHANAINGHEQHDIGGSDLQYACTFPLADPAPCNGDTCDCNAGSDPNDPTDMGELARNRPLCQPPAGGPAEPTQYFGKAYPGLRPLEVLRGIGDSAIVASICPKILNKGQPGYGYEPAVDAIVDRLKEALVGGCPPRPLAVQPGANGELPCIVVEAQDTNGAVCTCNASQRKPASPEAARMVQRQLAERLQCGTASTPSCSSFCFCELAQAEGQNRDRCLDDELGSDTPGYCYLDPFGSPPQGNPALVKDCGASQRMIRFVGPDTPTPGATAFIACLGATLH